MAINIEVYERQEDGSTALAEVRRVFRDAAGAPRCTVESPPGTVVEDRAASPDEASQLLAEERAQELADAMARLKGLDLGAIPSPYNQIIGDLLKVVELR